MLELAPKLGDDLGKDLLHGKEVKGRQSWGKAWHDKRDLATRQNQPKNTAKEQIAMVPSTKRMG